MEGRSVVSPNVPSNGRRPLIIGVAVAAAVLVAGGAATAALATGEDADSARYQPAVPAAAATTAPAPTGTAGGPQGGAAGAVRMEATRLVDGRGDVRGDGGGKGPTWADLTEVS